MTVAVAAERDLAPVRRPDRLDVDLRTTGKPRFTTAVHVADEDVRQNVARGACVHEAAAIGGPVQITAIDGQAGDIRTVGVHRKDATGTAVTGEGDLLAVRCPHRYHIERGIVGE